MNHFYVEMTKIAGVDDGHDTYKATRIGGYLGGGLGAIGGGVLGGVVGGHAAATVSGDVAKGFRFHPSAAGAAGGALMGAALLGASGALSGRAWGAGVDMLRHPDGAGSPDFRPVRHGAVAGAVIAPLAAVATHRPGAAGMVDRALGSVYGGALMGAGIGTLALPSKKRD